MRSPILEGAPRKQERYQGKGRGRGWGDKKERRKRYLIEILNIFFRKGKGNIPVCMYVCLP